VTVSLLIWLLAARSPNKISRLIAPAAALRVGRDKSSTSVDRSITGERRSFHWFDWPMHVRLYARSNCQRCRLLRFNKKLPAVEQRRTDERDMCVCVRRVKAEALWRDWSVERPTEIDRRDYMQRGTRTAREDGSKWGQFVSILSQSNRPDSVIRIDLQRRRTLARSEAISVLHKCIRHWDPQHTAPSYS